MSNQIDSKILKIQDLVQQNYNDTGQHCTNWVRVPLPSSRSIPANRKGNFLSKHAARGLLTTFNQNRELTNAILCSLALLHLRLSQSEASFSTNRSILRTRTSQAVRLH